ncbi:MAG: gamma-glutamyltransferase [Rhodospirillales bacterium]|nr:gamma-glutamyltransferase [Rhodospirillales bacterium]
MKQQFQTPICRKWLIRGALVLIAGLAPVGCATPDGPSLPKRHAISAANPHAARAGLAMLRAGGSAVDAAIAAQAVLSLVEPQSSGIGGGAFMLHYAGRTHHIDAYDGRETAPAGAGPELFLGPDKKPLKFYDAVIGGRSVGAPGVLRMLELAHGTHGKLPWARLFEPAIKLAENGFEISPRLHYFIGRAKGLKRYSAARRYFFTQDGKPKAVGTRLVNSSYAATLRMIAKQGADGMYRGPLARKIVEAVQNAAPNPGSLSLADLKNYRAVNRKALCRPYRQWKICTMPPPTSGGITTLQILGMVETFDLSALKPGSVRAVHLISEASRLAYADRAAYIADTDFVAVPVDGLLRKNYLKTRAGLISAARSMGKALPGAPGRRANTNPPGRRADAAPPISDAIEFPSTSHLTVVDDDGNTVSMTTSVENIFGSRLMVGGFMLNNQLTDFSFRPEIDGRKVANRVQPGKRPRSSMSPTIVLDGDGKLVLALGSPGGSRIIGYVARALIATLDWRLGLADAFALPNHVNRNGPTELEKGTALEAIASGLEALGHEIRLRTLTTGLHGMRATRHGYDAAADPRREGVALGD